MAIVVGYVPNPEGRAALQRAVEEAALRNTKVVVLNSSRGDAYVDTSFASEQDLDSVREQLAAGGAEYEVRQLVRGRSPAEELVTVADELNADLIVIGVRRRSPVRKLLLGSDAQRILLDAPCPVLAVKAA